jgi:hypothetical protein
MMTLHPSDLHACLDGNASGRARRIALSAALLAALTACHSPSPRATAPERVQTPPSAREPADGSYDWHVLLIAPFGSVLKEIPAALHEVLLFRDDAHGNGAAGNAAAGNTAAGSAATGSAAADAAAVDAECYATETPAPRFVGRVPDEYLLCFKQDRLSRIQASVRVAVAQASDEFAAACAGWLKNAASSTGVGEPGVGASGAGVSAAGAPGAVSPSAEAQNAGACEGRDGAIRFRGRLEEEPGPAETPQMESVLSITLDSAPNP